MALRLSFPCWIHRHTHRSLDLIFSVVACYLDIAVQSKFGYLDLAVVVVLMFCIYQVQKAMILAMTTNARLFYIVIQMQD